jgi:hypothetical protein
MRAGVPCSSRRRRGVQYGRVRHQHVRPPASGLQHERGRRLRGRHRHRRPSLRRVQRALRDARQRVARLLPRDVRHQHMQPRVRRLQHEPCGWMRDQHRARPAQLRQLRARVRLAAQRLAHVRAGNVRAGSVPPGLRQLRRDDRERLREPARHEQRPLRTLRQRVHRRTVVRQRDVPVPRGSLCAAASARASGRTRATAGRAAGRASLDRRASRGAASAPRGKRCAVECASTRRRMFATAAAAGACAPSTRPA